jgi:hypothetical protein
MLNIVVSMTATKENINYIHKTIESIKNQTVIPNNIYLTIPDYSNNKYKRIKIPTQILNDKQIVIIKYKKDYKKLLNILGPLTMINDDNTLIVTINNNNIYSKYLLEDLINIHKKNPKSAIGYSGYIFGKNPFFCYCEIQEKKNYFPFHSYKIKDKKGINVDVLNNDICILFKRSFFPKYEPFHELLKYSDTDKSLKDINSDMLISGYLSKKNIKRLTFKNDRQIISNTLINNYNTTTKFINIYSSFNKLRNNGMFNDYLVCEKYYKTFTFSLLIFIIFIIFCISTYISLNKK